MNPLIIFAMVSFGLIFFLGGVYLAFRMTRKSITDMQKAVPSVALRQGRNRALVCLVVFILVTIVLTVAIRHWCQWPLGQSFQAVLGVLSVFFFVAFFQKWFRGRSRAGPLVLDCGEHLTKRLFLINAVMWSVFAVFAVAAVLVTAFLGKDDLLIRILVALWLASFAIYWFIMTFGRLQIRENGVWYYTELLNWDRIESHEWLGEPNPKLILKTRAKPPFFGRGALPLPLEYQDAVDELLRKYVPGCEMGEASNAAESISPESDDGARC
jgi:hypothetical protein